MIASRTFLVCELIDVELIFLQNQKVDPTKRPCPHCEAPRGAPCGPRKFLEQGRTTDAFCQVRLAEAILRKGRPIVFNGMRDDFWLDLRTGRYWDRIPGTAYFVRRPL